MDDPATYDPRYLAGILFFNQRAFFEAHEVWEDLWADTPGPERRFFQGLIQAAVGLYHYSNGNLRGARKLYETSQAYMKPFGPLHRGLNVADFWERMHRCFQDVLVEEDLSRNLRPQADSIPVIAINPEPAEWPDPQVYVDSEDE
jgi:predicted metal-dependent hydrolase